MSEQRATARLAVEARGVRRSFGAIQAVAGVDLAIKPGMVTGLVGPNGSGKTTLLLMLAGLLAPDDGEIRIGGYDPVTEGGEVRCRVGWMPDQLGTWDTLTCAETLATFAAANRVPRAQVKGRVAALLDKVSLTDLADQRAHVLSRGQKQRLALARALLNEPTVLLLDEPTSGLDPGARIDLKNALRQAAAEGAAVVVSSHILSELDEVVDDAVFLSEGRSVARETVAEARAGQRGWRVDALDPTRLRIFLSELGIEWREAGPADSAVILDLTGAASASEFIRAAVGAGVDICSVAPAGGVLEQAYLRITEEHQ